MLKVFLTIGSLQFLTMLVQLVRTKGLALLLGPESVGLMAVIDKLMAVFAQTASLSLPFAALRFLPAAWERSPRTYAALLKPMLRLLAATSIIATAVGLIGNLVGTGWARELADLRVVVFAAFMTVPTLVLVPFIQSALAGRLQHNASMAWMVGHAAAFSLAGIVGAWAFGLTGLYLAYVVLGTALVAGAAWWLVHSSRVGATPSEVVSGPLGIPASIWRFTGPLFGLAFLAPYAALYVHYSVLAHLGERAAGLMQAAVGVSLAVRAGLGSGHSVFLTPNINRRGTFEERLAWANDYQKTLCWLAVAGTPLLLLFPSLAVTLLYSRAFADAGEAMWLFVAGEVILLLAGTYSSLIVAFNHIAVHVTQNLVAQAILIGIAAFLVPRIGIAGAGWAAVAMGAFLFAATCAFLRVRYGTWPQQGQARLLIWTTLVLAGCGIAGVMLPSLTWTSIGIKVLCYSAGVAGALALFTRADRARLTALTTQVASVWAGRLR